MSYRSNVSFDENEMKNLNTELDIFLGKRYQNKPKLVLHKSAQNMSFQTAIGEKSPHRHNGFLFKNGGFTFSKMEVLPFQKYGFGKKLE